MKRRTFLTLSLASAAGLAFSSAVYLKFFYTEPSNLIKELSQYFHEDFAAVAGNEPPGFMLNQLLKNNVISINGTVNKDALKEASKNEEPVSVNDWLYSQSEYYLYSLAYLAKTKGFIPL